MSEKETDVLEVLEPSSEIRTIVLAEGTDEETVLYQKPLTFFRKIELFSVLGTAIERALSEGTTISELLDAPANTPGSVNEIRESDVFVKALAKVAVVAPELLEDIYCISLDVPRHSRDRVKYLLRQIDDEQGIEILNTFIDQNWDAMQDFFGKQINPLINKVSEKMASRSTSSKPSKATQTRTRKQ